MRFVMPRRGRYTGRLAFDGEFHVDGKGRRVVTDDGGATWRYARRKDTGHNSRHSRRFVTVDGTQNAENPEPHHYGVHQNDPHVDGLQFNPDALAPTVTSHTDAWKEA